MTIDDPGLEEKTGHSDFLQTRVKILICRHVSIEYQSGNPTFRPSGTGERNSDSGSVKHQVLPARVHV